MEGLPLIRDVKGSFQHTADFLWPFDSSSSKDAHIPKPKPPSNYHFASKSLERPHSPSFAFKTPHISKPFVIVGETYIFAILLSLLVSLYMFAVLSIGSSRLNCSCHSNFKDFASAVEYSVAYFVSIFGSTKVRSDQVWNKKNPHASKGQDALLNPSK